MTNPESSWQTVSGEPRLADDEVHVWRIDLDRGWRPLTEAAAILSEAEGRRAAAFHFERDQRRYVIGRAALRRILGAYLALPPSGLRFAYGKQGKPELASLPGDTGLRFNLSHSAGLALLGVTHGRTIGVDLERIRLRTEIDQIASRFFSTRENRALRALPKGQRREAFFRCWTRKEAYLKAVGSGVFGGSTTFDVSLVPSEPARLVNVRGDPLEAARWAMYDLTPASGFVGAVLARASGLRFELFQDS